MSAAGQKLSVIAVFFVIAIQHVAAARKPGATQSQKVQAEASSTALVEMYRELADALELIRHGGRATYLAAAHQLVDATYALSMMLEDPAQPDLTVQAQRVYRARSDLALAARRGRRRRALLLATPEDRLRTGAQEPGPS